MCLKVPQMQAKATCLTPLSSRKTFVKSVRIRNAPFSLIAWKVAKSSGSDCLKARLNTFSPKHRQPTVKPTLQIQMIYTRRNLVVNNAGQ